MSYKTKGIERPTIKSCASSTQVMLGLKNPTVKRKAEVKPRAKYQKREKLVVDDISDFLKNKLFHKQIIWYRRLHNGMFYTRQGRRVIFGKSIFTDESKDLDYEVLFNRDDGKLACLFIEAKRKGKTKADPDQVKFISRMSCEKNIYTIVIDDIEILNKTFKFIKEIYD